MGANWVQLFNDIMNFATEYRIKVLFGSRNREKGKNERFGVFFSEIGVSILELGLFFINFALANKKEGRLSEGPSEIERTLREQRENQTYYC